MYEPDPSTRAMLRHAAQLAAARRVEEEPAPLRHRARFPALHALLAEAAVLFIKYELYAWSPMSSQPVFSFGGPGTLTVHVKPELDGPHLRGILREQSANGGPVRAVPVDLADLVWDPALGRWVAANPTEVRGPLDLVVMGLLRALRLT